MVRFNFLRICHKIDFEVNMQNMVVPDLFLIPLGPLSIIVSLLAPIWRLSLLYAYPPLKQIMPKAFDFRDVVRRKVKNLVGENRIVDNLVAYRNVIAGPFIVECLFDEDWECCNLEIWCMTTLYYSAVKCPEEFCPMNFTVYVAESSKIFQKLHGTTEEKEEKIKKWQYWRTEENKAHTRSLTYEYTGYLHFRAVVGNEPMYNQLHVCCPSCIKCFLRRLDFNKYKHIFDGKKILLYKSDELIKHCVDVMRNYKPRPNVHSYISEICLNM